MTDIKFLCPYMDTGGPENIHQVCAKLDELGYDSSIAYVSQFQVTAHLSKFVKYGNKISPFSKISRRSLVVIPEYLSMLSFNPEVTGAMFWLSLDNSADIKAGNDIKKLAAEHNIKYHFAQSKYAYDFLTSLGIENVFMLSDYIGEMYFNRPNNGTKKPQILYNPKKGIEFTKYVMLSNPDLKFIPIQGMTPNQIVDLMDESMMYIDFGTHPGKDRIPREAALRNCIVLTNRNGAADNDVDVPIPNEYKIHSVLSNLGKIREQIHYALSNYDAETKKFDSYRDVISKEKQVFDDSVKNVFSEIEKDYK